MDMNEIGQAVDDYWEDEYDKMTNPIINCDKCECKIHESEAITLVDSELCPDCFEIETENRQNE